jgi:hypothetical protein
MSETTQVRLEDLTPEQMTDKAAELRDVEAYFAWLTPIREEAFERRAMALTGAANFAPFVSAMATLHGPRVRVWRNTLSWLAALAVVRYGEALDHWPAAWSIEDLQRAQRWLDGKVPEGVTYIVVEG